MNGRYFCKKCNFVTSDKRDMKRHENTKKHKKICGIIYHKRSEKEQFICEACGKEYKYRSGLSRHYKKCKKYNFCETKESSKKEIDIPEKEPEIQVKYVEKEDKSVNALMAIIKQQQEQLDKTH